MRAKAAADVSVFQRIHELRGANGELIGVILPADGRRCVDGLEKVPAQDVTKTN